MPQNIKTLALGLPARTYKRLQKLAEITGVPLEQITIRSIESEVDQVFGNKDLDCVIPFIGYDTLEEATQAAGRANQFDTHSKFCVMLEPSTEDGKFYIVPKWEKLSKHAPEYWAALDPRKTRFVHLPS